MSFDRFFQRAAGQAETIPHAWQTELGTSMTCRDRLIRIPTGFGKTLGVLAAWSWNRVERDDDSWPRRLVWCLPMRVLVEQIDAEMRRVLDRLGHLWDGKSDHRGKIGVHVLMGGADNGDWHVHPDHCAILIGTQDMLLSRALNRGYASPRARWPMEFGLLNQDCLWVMDEVQLMDAGLATSAQLQQFRNDDQGKSQRPICTWWMSATLQPAWLAKSPDTAAMAETLAKSALHIEAGQRKGPLWDQVAKSCRVELVRDERALAKQVAQAHLATNQGVTLVVVNRVERALALADALHNDRSLKTADIRLIHSRFRPIERAAWRSDFLNRAACAPGVNRIIVATQVVEAGVDISANVLVTELAPWASLVQRFGRCARWGGTAQVIVADFGAATDKAALPYSPDELAAAREALKQLNDVSPLHLEAFEESHPERLAELYPFSPKHLLLRHELDELFDTSSDLSGADVDISRFVRSGEERDLHVFWRDVPLKTEPNKKVRATRGMLCAVPFLKARDWLCGPETASKKASRLKSGMRAWIWDWLDGAWRVAERRDLYPGVTVLVDAKCGGYDAQTGWRPEAGPLSVELLSVGEAAPDNAMRADDAEDDESLSILDSDHWQTIAFHGRETGMAARRIATALTPDWADLFDLAGRWHDAGKAHAAFQGSIIADCRPTRLDLAKAPKEAWLRGDKLYPMPDGLRRAGFRHELASTLALFAVLQRHGPDHPALRGPYRALLERIAQPLPDATSDVAPTPLEQEILDLDRIRFDLLAWLVCTHHGKVRMAWHVSPKDQAATDNRLRIRGVRDGETLPSLWLADARGDVQPLPESRMDLSPAAAGLNPRTGPGWTERVLGLLQAFGPFTLAWFEALMRAADIRASRQSGLLDPLLFPENLEHELENDHRRVAQAAQGNADDAPSGTCAGTDLAEHGVRTRAGEFELAQGATQPHDATRHFDTAKGRLSYAELAQHLAAPLLHLEQRIRRGEFSHSPFDQRLLLDFHATLIADLFPQQAGRYRQNEVRVSAHEPPPPWQVAVRILDYVRNLDARLQHLPSEPDERWLEVLAYAEGELLSIHPFPDLNGRISRVWLSELLRRMGLPPVDIVPSDAPFRPRYLAALAAADRHDWQPLMALWRERLERPGEEP